MTYNAPLRGMLSQGIRRLQRHLMTYNAPLRGCCEPTSLRDVALSQGIRRLQRHLMTYGEVPKLAEGAPLERE